MTLTKCSQKFKPGFVKVPEPFRKKESESPILKGVQFVSPNIKENTTFEYAENQIKSVAQKQFRTNLEDIDKRLEMETKSYDGIGDWADGAENTVYTELLSDVSYDKFKYSSALKGLLGNQKVVIPFLMDSEGKNFLFELNIKETDFSVIRKVISDNQVQFRTLVPTEEGTKILIYDESGESLENINKIAEYYDTKTDIYKGTGELLGGETREEAAKIFERIVRDFEKVSADERRQPKKELTERVPTVELLTEEAKK